MTRLEDGVPARTPPSATASLAPCWRRDCQFFREMMPSLPTHANTWDLATALFLSEKKNMLVLTEYSIRASIQRMSI